MMRLHRHIAVCTALATTALLCCGYCAAVTAAAAAAGPQHRRPGRRGGALQHVVQQPPEMPWIKKVHVVSMTHLDVGGWGPNAPECEDSCRYSASVCNSYFDNYMPAAAATANRVKAMRKKPPPPAPPPPPPGAGKCWPGHAYSHARQDWDCPGYRRGFDSTQCEAVGCCTDPKLYPNRSSGWCYPVHQPPKPLNVSFIYSTHPWLLQEYFNATASCGRGLPSRNTTQMATVEAAVRAGEIAWHAKPFTMIHELADPNLLAWSLNISHALNSRFGVTHGLSCGKATDLQGVSIGIVPLLARAGVKGLHLGTNGLGGQAFPKTLGMDATGSNMSSANGGSQPAVSPLANEGVAYAARVFRWKHPDTGDEIVMMLEQHYGRSIVLPESTGFDEALVFEFTGDNRAPPSVSAVGSFWQRTQQRFPNAELQASTLDRFTNALWEVKASLPIVTQEISNAWLPQMGTDPWRFKALRAVSRLRSNQLAQGKLQWDDPDLSAYNSRLIVLIEHNFGMNTRKVISPELHDHYWTNAEFHPRMNKPDPNVSLVGYPGLTEYSTERDHYIYPRPARSGASSGFKEFVALVNTTLKALEHVPSAAAMVISNVDLKEIDITDAAALTLENAQLALKFDPQTGAISSLLEKGTVGREWVAAGQLLGNFVYRTYTQEADINRYCSQFTPQYNATDTNMKFWPWQKPGMDLSIEADPTMPPLSNCSRSWSVRLTKAWKSDATMLLQLALPDTAVRLFGGMGQITLNVTLLPRSSSSSSSSTSAVELTTSWKNKTATRLAESSWISFVPSVPHPQKGWRLDVLGSPVDPLSVVVNGSRHLHAVHRGVCYDDHNVSPGFPSSSSTQPLRLAIESLDVPLVAPGDTAHLIDFDNQLPDLRGGFHFNLHNNVGWDASAPWWYGRDASFRFRLYLNPPQAGCWGLPS